MAHLRDMMSTGETAYARKVCVCICGCVCMCVCHVGAYVTLVYFIHFCIVPSRAAHFFYMRPPLFPSAPCKYKYITRLYLTPFCAIPLPLPLPLPSPTAAPHISPAVTTCRDAHSPSSYFPCRRPRLVFFRFVLPNMAARFYIELKIAALNLRGRRIDPFAILVRPPATHPPPDTAIISQTEVVWSDRNPAFVHSFEIDLPDPSHTPPGEYRILLYSKTSRSDELRKNTFLGYAEFSLDRVFAKRDGVIERVLRNRHGKCEPKRGSVVVCGERVRVDGKHMFSIQFGFGAGSRAWGPHSGRKAKKSFYVRGHNPYARKFVQIAHISFPSSLRV